MFVCAFIKHQQQIEFREIQMWYKHQHQRVSLHNMRFNTEVSLYPRIPSTSHTDTGRTDIVLFRRPLFAYRQKMTSFGLEAWVKGHTIGQYSQEVDW